MLFVELMSGGKMWKKEEISFLLGGVANSHCCVLLVS
jgi:hypothetical protein